jgi:hypothetical protein
LARRSTQCLLLAHIQAGDVERKVGLVCLLERVNRVDEVDPIEARIAEALVSYWATPTVDSTRTTSSELVCESDAGREPGLPAVAVQ